MNTFTATYSPDDNKLRLYSTFRLDAETYAQAKEHGFRWAPKQELFVAPMWTPQREDFLLTLVDEIEDEDKTLADRQEERAERFEEYSDKRAEDAEHAHKAVASIADGIPLGQPILVGHHSERRARKDAERIENGMRKAVKMWETSKYWEQRAAGALAHAKYKELPTVRARRIKGIEADKRKYEKYVAHAEKGLQMWSNPALTLEQALIISGVYRLTMARKEGDREDFNQSPDAWSALSNSYPNLYAPRTLAEVVETAKRVYPKSIEHYKRWLSHFENRLTYEKAMLGEQGALDLIAPKARPKQLPLVNYKAPEGITIESRYHRGEFQTCRQVEMTKAEYSAVYEDNKYTSEVEHSHRVRMLMIRGKDYSCERVTVFLTDSKEHTRPAPATPKQSPEPKEPAQTTPRTYQAPERTKFDDLKDSLKAGVQTVSAPQLFPTPSDLAARMVEIADIKTGMRVLEPSAGTGNILTAIMNDDKAGSVVAVEVNKQLADRLKSEYILTNVQCVDFLQFDRTAWPFDRIIMNPPFVNGDDIKHIKHAMTFLKPGGTLVAICAGGPRQKAALEPLASLWEELPAGTFAAQGTGVNTVLLTIEGS